MSQTKLARRMGRPTQAINAIVNGKKALTEETALELERVLGTPAQVWVNLEARYRLALARAAEDSSCGTNWSGSTTSRCRRWKAAAGFRPAGNQ